MTRFDNLIGEIFGVNFRNNYCHLKEINDLFVLIFTFIEYPEITVPFSAVGIWLFTKSGNWSNK